ncbi:MAG: aldehyde dehydrogenase [Candidatus Eremiobacteraeota bacterium]|nr:aldehyde dehydrogenase [Candidatus Eremiobacteraeota bacterium]
MTQQEIEAVIRRQRSFFESGKTGEYQFRHERLKALRELVTRHENEIYEALRADLGRPQSETFFGELLFVQGEIENALTCLHSWMKPKAVGTPLLLSPGSSSLHSEPYGVTLIIGPWNYPFQLMMAPLVGAVAAGNCVVLKPSEISSHTSSLLARLIPRYFEPGYIDVVEGGVEESGYLLQERLDYLFYTGNPAVGRIVMEAAARHLTPLTLELGGKSPCIFYRNFHFEAAVKRIVWGKFFNAGQTCVAPDYLLLYDGIADEIIKLIQKTVADFFGDDPKKSPDYSRIINERHFKRLTALMEEGRIITGGAADAATRYIAPTVIDEVTWDSKIMEEEIFGPLLPVIYFDNLDKVLAEIRKRPKPLALYLFSEDRETQRKVIRGTSSGGMCINDTLVHISTRELPFGGVGQSGMGAYHGKYTFDTFSHRKSVMERSLLLDPSFRYPPYPAMSPAFRKILGFLG